MIQCREGTRQHGRMHFPTADGGEQINLLRKRSDGRSEGEGILPDLIGGGTEDIAVAQPIGCEQDI